MDSSWTPIVDALPPEGEVVETIKSDHEGTRNQQPLKRNGGLWFLPDDSMYVYYTPSHWRRR